MKYCIMLEKVGQQILTRGWPKNQSGQIVAFYNTAHKPFVINLASELSKECGLVQVFKGRDVGHLCAEWINGRMSFSDESK